MFRPASLIRSVGDVGWTWGRRARAQGQAAIREKMVFRPASLDTKFHRRLVEAVDRRHVKAVRARARAPRQCTLGQAQRRRAQCRR